MPRRVLTLALALIASSAAASSLGSWQLVLVPGMYQASLNGQGVRWLHPPQQDGGRVYVPIDETRALLRLDAIDPPTPVRRDFSVPYVDVQWLTQHAGVTLDGTPGRGVLALTATALPMGDPALPQARFSSTRATYAPGEHVDFAEYSFSPDGTPITRRDWQDRVDAYPAPGDYDVTLRVTDALGRVSEPMTRTVRVQGPAVTVSPLAPVQTTLSDPRVLEYPLPAAQVTTHTTFPLLFSDSPERPGSAGVLYRDTVRGRARVLAYHINGMTSQGRVLVIARNTSRSSARVTVTRMGESAPARSEGTLGQVALMDFFASTAAPQLYLPPGRSGTVYASPVIAPGSGVHLLQDIDVQGEVELTVLLLPEGRAPTPDVIAALPTLPRDAGHQRGTFPGAVRDLRVTLGALPARLVIADGHIDSALQGTDALTGDSMRLSGNYGLLYRVLVSGARGTTVALSPRGGTYRGALRVIDGSDETVMRVPFSGIIKDSAQPLSLWQVRTDTLYLEFIPASGSNLPVSLIFYPSAPPPAQ